MPLPVQQNPLERYATVRAAAMTAGCYQVSLVSNDFEAGSRTNFAIDASLGVRIAKGENRGEASSDSSEYLYRDEAFACARKEYSDSRGGGQYVAVYCVDTGGIVRVTENDADAEPPRPPSARELDNIFTGARTILDELPDVELTPEGTCSSSKSYEPVALGSTTYTPTSHVDVSIELCSQWQQLRDKAAQIRVSSE
jgi:hypothetical protein